MQKVIIVGGGVGGLATAALLARAGVDVTVLEAHVYVGGCAGTFYHKGYRFDAGATLAGGYYPGGPMDIISRTVGIEAWPLEPANPAMTVHLPDGTVIDRYGDERRWDARREAFGGRSLGFWRWQEDTADALWDFALRNPPWPPQTLGDFTSLAGKVLGWFGTDFPRHLSPALALDALRPAKAHLRGLGERLKLFTDAQLLIASQATADDTFALYAASALDLPRRGTAHLEGGIGSVAEILAEAVERNGGEVITRAEVTGVRMERGRPVAVRTKRKGEFACDHLIFNLPPWNIAKIMGADTPAPMRRLPESPRRGGGAFMVYVGLDEGAIPPGFALHHQVIKARPLGEGNTIFLSLSAPWDETRAPQGQRTLTISTHTQHDPWWAIEGEAYEARKDAYTERILDVAESVIPNLREAAELIMPGTPVTFQRFTRREYGWVGGFPQTSPFTAWGPRIGRRLWMVGDTIFPGQSVPAVALGGLRVAEHLLAEMGRPLPGPLPVTPRYGVEEGLAQAAT